jgi:hypothetical protein
MGLSLCMIGITAVNALVATSFPDGFRLVDLPGPFLVSRLLLALLIEHDTLIRTKGRLGLSCRHALLAAMFAALILHTFQIVFFGHRDWSLFSKAGGLEPCAINAIPPLGFHSGPGLPCLKIRTASGTQIRVASSDSRIFHPERIPMRSRLAISALVLAAMLGATAIASAQTQPAAGASSEGTVTPGATTTHSKMKSGKTKISKMKSGTTTGMSSGANPGDSAPKNTDSK